MNSKSQTLRDTITTNYCNWKIFEIVIDTPNFQRNVNSISQLYRKLTNSKCSIGGITNRDYFKKINGGGYFFKQGLDKTQIVLCLEGEKISNIQLMVRIRKILPNSVVSVRDNEILEYLDSFKFQPVGKYYFTLN
jgi:hypothetical protein